jgi:hypothetical protein
MKTAEDCKSGLRAKDGIQKHQSQKANLLRPEKTHFADEFTVKLL